MGLCVRVVMPSVSFLGHLSGLLAGLTYVRGFLNRILLRPAMTARGDAVRRAPLTHLHHFLCINDPTVCPSLHVTQCNSM